MRGGDLPELEHNPESDYLSGWLPPESEDTRSHSAQRQAESLSDSALGIFNLNPMAGQQDQERLPDYSMVSDPG